VPRLGWPDDFQRLTADRVDKGFNLGGERNLTFRLEAFNALNHPNKGLPNRNVNDPSTFGQIFQNTDAPKRCSSRSRSPATIGSVGKRT